MRNERDWRKEKIEEKIHARVCENRSGQKMRGIRIEKKRENIARGVVTRRKGTLLQGGKQGAIWSFHKKFRKIRPKLRVLTYSN